MRAPLFPRPVLAAAALLGLAAATASNAQSGQPAAPGIPCRAVSILSVWAPAGAPLVVSANGVVVGVHEGSISREIGPFLKRGANRVELSYAAPGTGGTEVALKCRPPGGDSKVTVLTLKPTAERLRAEAHVDYTP